MGKGSSRAPYVGLTPQRYLKQVPEVPIYPGWEEVDLEGMSGGGGSLVAVAPGSFLGHVQVGVSMGPAWCLLSALFAGCFTRAVPTGKRSKLHSRAGVRSKEEKGWKEEEVGGSKLSRKSRGLERRLV